MALQWMILTYVVAAEAALAFILTLPSPQLLKSRLVSLVSLILQPALFVVPFSGFQLLDIYWKNEHRLMCTSETCTATERDRYEKSVFLIRGFRIPEDLWVFCFAGFVLDFSWVPIDTGFDDEPDSIASLNPKIYKAERNVILCVSAILLYWCIYRICKFYKELQNLEEVEKRCKAQ
ncbi:hypothetical protein EZV62_023453 [Acer yangbiense]|uniref:Endoplasmic reticulum transmembrane protein n=1 Tax=Acer yangbiense TaxID=1000413 RepID=A0A5C7H2H1_9ROSI|nr:hypothetical protein EZV62_023453 [Acer yangbiense]